MISLPFTRYKVCVSHLTARRSTALEWMVLEAISRCTTLPAQEQAAISAGHVFEEIFLVADADKLILPCILNLQDLGALTTEGLSDDSELESVPMSSLRLTPIGRQMQSEGLLPGAKSEDIFDVLYNQVQKELVSDTSARYTEKPTGTAFPMDDAPSFPAFQIKEMLQDAQQKGDKGRRRFPWMEPSTKIDHIEPVETQLLWRNMNKRLDVGPELVCSLDDISEPALIAKILAEMAANSPEELTDLPPVKVSDPDKEIQALYPPVKVSAVVNERLQNDPLFIATQDYLREEIIGASRSRKGSRPGIVLVDGCEVLDVTLRSKQLIVRIPERLLPNACVYMAQTFELCLGKFALRAGEVTFDIPLGFSPNTPEKQVDEIACRIARKYGTQDRRLTLILYVLQSKEDFSAYLLDACRTLSSIQEKAAYLDALNQDSRLLFGQATTVVTVETARRIILDDEIIRGVCATYDGAITLLKECETLNIFRQQNSSLYTTLLGLVVQDLPPAPSLVALQGLWSQICSSKQANIAPVLKDGLYRRLYSDRVIDDLLKAFGQDDFFDLVMPDYTPVEQTLYTLKQLFVQAMDCLPELCGSDALHSNQSVLEAILNHKNESVQDLQEIARSWRDETDRFSARVRPLDTVDDSTTAFGKAMHLMTQIIDALSRFYDGSLQFNRIVIVDTCTLMNRPELLEWFLDGKNMLIVPQQVLKELDGLKESVDADKAYQAREVIRKLAEYQFAVWLNTQEVSDVSLLNDDLDKNGGDSKILSIAIRYIARDPILITDDTNFRNIAAAQGLTVMNVADYEKAKQYATAPSPERKMGKKKKRH